MKTENIISRIVFVDLETDVNPDLVEGVPDREDLEYKVKKHLDQEDLIRLDLDPDPNLDQKLLIDPQNQVFVEWVTYS